MIKKRIYVGKMHIRFNTSNKDKQRELTEFLKMFGWSVDFSEEDLREPFADPDTVIASKASRLPGIFVEDSALFIEGCDEAGVSIKWFMDRIDSMVGRRASFQVRIARLEGEKVLIWSGKVDGQIVQGKGNSKFGFDNVFVPNGATVPYSLSKPNELNPRCLAIESLIYDAGRYVRPIFNWTGEWQD